MRKTWMGLAAMALLAGTFPAAAQYDDGYESGYTADADGEILTGQNGYYIPPAGGVDFKVYTYAGNTLGLPANPTGGENFVAGITIDATLARAQKDVVYGDGTGVWTVCFDVCAGTAAANNLGSFSTQDYQVTPPLDATFIMLMRWDQEQPTTEWNADIVYDNAGGTAVTAEIPDTNFQDKASYHWYQRCGTFDLATNTITELTLTDLETGDTFTYVPTDWYLDGGSAGGLPPPSGFRLFCGGGVGNQIAYDNIKVYQPSAPGCNGDEAVKGKGKDDGEGNFDIKATGKNATPGENYTIELYDGDGNLLDSKDNDANEDGKVKAKFKGYPAGSYSVAIIHTGSDEECDSKNFDVP